MQKEWDLLHFNNIAVRQDMSAHEALSETREINETIPQRIIGIEPEQHRFKKGKFKAQGDHIERRKEKEVDIPK